MAAEITVMVVDDDHDIRELLSDYLEGHGYQVLLAAGGEAMREMLETTVPDVVLLDNMDAATLRKAIALVEKLHPATKTEASGGIKLDTIAEKAETGVDYISTGWITHSAPVLDLGLDTSIS